MTELLSDVQNTSFVYKPAKDDPIDKKLADFINNVSTRNKFNKFMFRRETEGVYTYGRRRVFIKLEKGQIIIRVGGGYLTIDEFIDFYSPFDMR